MALLARTGAAALVEVVELVVVDPVRDGRLRSSGWPSGLRAAAGVGLLAFVVAAVLTVLAPTIRAHSDLVVAAGGDLIFPRWTLAVFVTLAVVALALVHTASLHLTIWLRLLVPVAVVVVLAGTVSLYYDQDHASTVASWVGCAVVLALTAARWRGSFTWWEFPASLGAIGGTVALVLRYVDRYSAPFGVDAAPLSLTTAMQSIAVLAVPFTFVAGVAFAQLALLMATRVGAVLDERLRSTTPLAVLVAALAVVDATLAVHRWRASSEYGIGHLRLFLTGTLLVALAVGLVVLVLARGRDDVDGTGQLGTALSVVAFPVAVLVSGISIVQLLVSRTALQLQHYTNSEQVPLSGLMDRLDSSGAITTTRFAGAVLLVGWAAWQRRRLPVAAGVAGCAGVVIAVSYARPATSGVVDLPWEAGSVNDAAAALALVWLLVLLVRRRLTRRRLIGLGVVLGLALAWSVRTTFDAPFVAVVGLGATAAVFLGTVWALLTGAEEANGDSPGYPRPARVLFFLGNALLTMTVLAFAAVARTGRIGLDASAYGTLGDDYLGTGLLLAAYGLLAVAVVRDEHPLPRRPTPPLP